MQCFARMFPWQGLTHDLGGNIHPRKAVVGHVQHVVAPYDTQVGHADFTVLYFHFMRLDGRFWSINFMACLYTLFTVKPNSRIITSPGADAPKRSMPITSPWSPTYLHQP